MASDSTARNVAQRVDALAEALRAAGVSPERSAGLLAAAATASMNAVMLDAVLEEMHAGSTVPVPEVGPLAHPIKLAA
jgi:DNA-binding ferritin-like protein